jgi:hypothetical protein
MQVDRENESLIMVFFAIAIAVAMLVFSVKYHTVCEVGHESSSVLHVVLC